MYHLSVHGNYMATAGPNGFVQIYQIEPQILGQAGKGLSHKNEILFGETALVILELVKLVAITDFTTWYFIRDS
jgi:hypothetical protein